MMTAEAQHVFVLRIPEEEGNYKYWMAELSDDDASRWKRRLAQGEIAPADEEVDMAFGHPLTLTEVMQRLHSRDFQVLDYRG